MKGLDSIFMAVNLKQKLAKIDNFKNSQKLTTSKIEGTHLIYIHGFLEVFLLS